MKKIIVLLLVIICCSNTFAQSTARPSTSKIFSKTYKSGLRLDFKITSETNPATVCITGMQDEKRTKKLELPETTNFGSKEFIITAIGDKAFENADYLASVSVPKSIKSIGNEAFMGCSALKSIKFEGEIEHCGKNSFTGTAIAAPIYTGNILVYYSPKAKGFTINEGTKSVLEYAFSDCTELTEISIPSSVSTIYQTSFYGCKNLKNISVAQGNSTYDSRNNCNAVIISKEDKMFISCANTTIPQGVKSVSAKCFANSEITDIDLPASLNIIEDSAFMGSKIQKVTIPEQVKSIGKNAFANCTELQVVDFNAQKCNDADENLLCFEGCYSISSVNFGNEVETIPAYIFKGCNGLRFANFTNSVKEIREGAFENCSMLSYIELPNTIEKSVGSAFRGTGLSDALISGNRLVYYPEYGLNEYSIPQGIEIIGERAFFDNQNIQKIEIAKTVKTIEKEAFSQSAVKEVIMPNSVTELGVAAFKYCTRLEKISLPNSLSTIRLETFMGCSKLTSFEFPNSVKNLENFIFYWCDNIEFISVPNSVEQIEENAFTGASFKRIFVSKGKKQKYAKMLPAEISNLILEK
ncbi:MAG: leucine-rich repeat domain-containing protein [Bacteroidales bacterium]|nr:leucine-rich repeat domain-containing protein [Bacteroidales bacterium]